MKTYEGKGNCYGVKNGSGYGDGYGVGYGFGSGNEDAGGMGTGAGSGLGFGNGWYAGKKTDIIPLNNKIAKQGR